MFHLYLSISEQWAGPLDLYGKEDVICEIAGVNTASLHGYLHISKTRTRWAERFHDELNGHVFDLKRDGLHQVVPCP